MALAEVSGVPIYQIPQTARRFEVVRGKAGGYMVVSETTGVAGVAIPAADQRQAEDVCDRLNRGNHDGTIEVRQFGGVELGERSRHAPV